MYLGCVDACRVFPTHSALDRSTALVLAALTQSSASCSEVRAGMSCVPTPGVADHGDVPEFPDALRRLSLLSEGPWRCDAMVIIMPESPMHHALMECRKVLSGCCS